MHLNKLNYALAVLVCLSAISFGQARAQCILANPSFELSGSGGHTFGGWNQFGVVGSVNVASHGSKAARVSGPNYGGWDVSAYWQSQDCAVGEQWRVTGHVLVPSSKPLVGSCVALVNVEWRDSGGNLIDYDSFTVADAGSPTDTYLDFDVTSGPAPSGTVSTRLLLGVLQSPSDPSPDVYYDQVTFYSTSYPTIDDVQWNDFPGGRTVEFGGYTWRVKGPGFYGPGANLFCDSSDCVWMDASDQLHLTLKNRSGSWYSTEVVNEQALGYGDYILTTVGRLDLIDPQAVLGIFLWQYGPCWDEGYLWWNPFNEIDIEYSRWQNPAADIAQFVAQPFDYPGNITRFDASFTANEVTSHAMRWLPDRVEYRVWRGGPQDESPANMIASWTYSGPHIPRPEQPRMHLNLWRIDGTPASNQEVIFQDFTFIPEGGATAVEEGSPRSIPSHAAARLYPAVPNPFNPQTTLRFELAKAGLVQLQVFDRSGRHVRTLENRSLAAGAHWAVWNGKDDQGRAVASGVYFLRLSGEGFQESQRVALVK